MTMHPDSAWNVSRQISADRHHEAASERLVRACRTAPDADQPADRPTGARPRGYRPRSATTHA